jgi:probable F420-dependent oxidoreductase
MRFWLSLVTNTEPEQMPEIARCAEQLGFEGVTVPDHLVMSTRIESRYPYTEDGKIWWPDDMPWLDPWVTLAAMGAATTRLRLATNIYLAALRDPFTPAKAVSTAAALAPGRVVCGVSVGWIREEYALAGVDFSSRGKRMDELIEVLRKLWTGRDVSHDGPFFRFEHAIMCPPPPQRVPIWCGGASPAALRRAALNDGWLGLPMTLEQLRPVAETLHAKRRETGLATDGFDIAFALAEPLTPQIAGELERIGARNLMVIAPWIATPWDIESWVGPGEDTCQLVAKQTALRRYSEAVISKFG